MGVRKALNNLVSEARDKRPIEFPQAGAQLEELKATTKYDQMDRQIDRRIKAAQKTDLFFTEDRPEETLEFDITMPGIQDTLTRLGQKYKIDGDKIIVHRPAIKTKEKAVATTVENLQLEATMAHNAIGDRYKISPVNHDGYIELGKVLKTLQAKVGTEHNIFTQTLILFEDASQDMRFRSIAKDQIDTNRIVVPMEAFSGNSGGMSNMNLMGGLDIASSGYVGAGDAHKSKKDKGTGESEQVNKEIKDIIEEQ